ncbi:MAG: hypothetical protein WD045_05180 [Pirellulaceae bacterium]
MSKTPSSKKARKRRKATTDPVRAAGIAESRATEAMTIFWMLCSFGTLMLLLAIGGLEISARMVAAEEDAQRNLLGVSGLVLFVAIVMGTFGLFLAPVVQYNRRRKAPRAINRVAIIICTIPWILLLARMGGFL